MKFRYFQFENDIEFFIVVIQRKTIVIVIINEIFNKKNLKLSKLKILQLIKCFVNSMLLKTTNLHLKYASKFLYDYICVKKIL